MILYFVLVIVIRLMGKRQIGQMEASEFVVALLVADLASIPMQNGDIPLLYGIVPILTVLGIELLLSVLCMRSIRLRRLLCGKPVILIENGHLLQKNLQKTRVTLDELTELLREKDILDLSTVQFAILETSGRVSVFPYPKDRPATAQEAGIAVQEQHLPITLISDGQLLPHNLRISGKDISWVEKTLKKKQSTVQDTLLLTVDQSGRVCWLPKEGI
jgi:uncharacterized membrane protein YcaP (DUF421 family)